MTLMTTQQFRRRITEAAMEAAVRDLVTLRGGMLFHVRDSRQSPELEHFPDWLIILPPTVYIVEAKSQKRVVTAGQRAVLDLLAQCSELRSGIVRPEPRDGEWAYDAFLAMLEG